MRLAPLLVAASVIASVPAVAIGPTMHVEGRRAARKRAKRPIRHAPVTPPPSPVPPPPAPGPVEPSEPPPEPPAAAPQRRSPPAAPSENAAPQQPAPPVVAAPQQEETAPATPGRALRFELALFGDLVGTLGDLGLGGGAGVEAGFSTRPRAGGAFSLRARAGYERFTWSSLCSPATCGAGQTHVDLAQDVLALTLAVTYRLPALGRLTPYVSALPTVAFARVQPPAVDAQLRPVNRTTLGIGGVAGLEAAVGPGGLFLELGYRWLTDESLETGAVSLAGLCGAFGYRLSL